MRTLAITASAIESGRKRGEPQRPPARAKGAANAGRAMGCDARLNGICFCEIRRHEKTFIVVAHISSRTPCRFLDETKAATIPAAIRCIEEKPTADNVNAHRATLSPRDESASRQIAKRARRKCGIDSPKTGARLPIDGKNFSSPAHSAASAPKPVATRCHTSAPAPGIYFGPPHLPEPATRPFAKIRGREPHRCALARWIFFSEPAARFEGPNGAACGALRKSQQSLRRLPSAEAGWKPRANSGRGGSIV